LAREGNGFVWSAEVAGEVAHAAKDVRGELVVAADLDQGQRPAEMSLSVRIPPGVVRHPPGFFCFDAVSLCL
jgi:hypothetical protein